GFTVIPQTGSTAMMSANRRQLRGRRESRLDVDRDLDQLVERLLDRRAHDAEPVTERLGLRVVAFRLDGHDLARQPGHAFFDTVRIHSEGAVAVDLEPALIEQVIELDGDALAVRLGDPEANRSKR